jgi:hypothetical protein
MVAKAVLPQIGSIFEEHTISPKHSGSMKKQT